MSIDPPDVSSGADSDASPPIEMDHYAWPVAELDPVVRMRALAAGLPHVACDESVFDVPFERLWSFVTDFEATTALFEGGVSGARILERTGERLQLEARGPIGGWTPFDVVLRPGWCLMRSRSVEVGMAARPEADGRTRFVHFEGSARIGRFGRPLFAWNIRQDFRRLRRLL